MKRILFILFLLVSLCKVHAQDDSFFRKLCSAGIALSEDDVQYDPSYFTLDYPMGDVPSNKGVCTDVIIRAYRAVGFDLQKAVHEDMLANFKSYPQNWGLKSPDKNIDHRRVPNLMCYFTRMGAAKKISQQREDYLPGDIVCWNLGGNITHIGLITNKKASHSDHYLIIHNIGAGQELEDCLFSFKIIGHYRFMPLNPGTDNPSH